MMNARRMLLLMTLALSASLVVWDRTRGVAVVVAPSKPAGSPLPAGAAKPATTGGIAIGALRLRDDYKDDATDAFAATSSPPPAPTAVQPLPLAPSAPPLPFTVIGKKFEAGTWEVYLSKGDHTYIVTKGMVLDSDYKVDDINATQLYLIYLPLNEKQTLPIGATFHD